MVGCRASAKTAAEREQPCVVPVLVVKACMVWWLSVQSAVVGRVYHVWASWWRLLHNVAVAVRIDGRGMVVKASVRSKWMMVWLGFAWK